MSSKRESPTTTALTPERIPDLCTPASILLLILAGAVVAFVFALAGSPGPEGFWQVFGLAFLFVLWVVLVSAALICSLKRWLASCHSTAVSWAVFLVIPLVTLLASLVVVAYFHFSPAISPSWFVLRNALISLLASLALVRYLVLQDRWRQQVAAETRARLDALQASIRPHFLFNALNTIASLVHDRPDRAEQATLDLSDLLRTGLKPGTTQTLAEELDLIRGYLRLESLRLGERLQVEWDLADDLPLDEHLPALLLQPLVENAVVHGIARMPEGGRLRIAGRLEKGRRLRFEIVNPVPADMQPGTEGNRMALQNIRQRLQLAFEEGARLRTTLEHRRFRVVLVIPLTG